MPGADDLMKTLNRSGVEITASSHNAYLAALAASVLKCIDVYKTNASVNVKVRALDDIMVKAAFWLTSKKPRTTPKAGKMATKNPARWDAMTDLANGVAKEAQSLGVKLLHSPSDFRQIAADPSLGRQSYWLERIDPSHRPGYRLSKLYEEWLGNGIDQTFWDYAAGSAIYQHVQFLNGGPPLVQYRVDCNDADKLCYTNSGADLFDTEFMTTVASGSGYGIFVSDSKHIYSSSHVLGNFHHSTFFGGGPVIGAGEIVAKDGEIKLITAKSGHYRPSSTDMRNMVTGLAWVPAKAIIIPTFAGSGNIIKAYRVRDFRASGINSLPITKKQFEQDMPGFIKGGAAYNKILQELPTSNVGEFSTRL